jgi:hypothetical protein
MKTLLFSLIFLFLTEFNLIFSQAPVGYEHQYMATIGDETLLTWQGGQWRVPKSPTRQIVNIGVHWSRPSNKH